MHHAVINQSSTEKIKLLYITGAARSGSTLLGLILEQIPDVCHVGELHHIWSRGFLQNEICTCGITFSGCPFWNQVREEAFGSHDNFDAKQMKRIIRSVQRIRKLPQILFPVLQGSEYRQTVNDYAEKLIRFYKAILVVSNCRLIVDSSKNPVYAFLLSRISLFDLHVAHLIRDSRAVAFSWQRKKSRLQVHSAKKDMSTYGSFQSACAWNLSNALSQALRVAAVTYQRIRYEDLVSNVRESIGHLLSPVFEVGPGDIPIDGRILRRGHAISGNPMRLDLAPINITLDDEWKVRLPKKEKWIATAATLPLLMYYGYRL